jgi:Tfp pilus assembly protein PilW
MRIQIHPSRTRVGRARRREAAMTLCELMISLGLFVVAVVGFLLVHIAGLGMNEMVRAKLGASDEARRALGRLVGDVRSAGVIRVGSGAIDRFDSIPAGQAQEGNAIQVYPIKGNTGRFIRYYWDADDGRLKRTEDGSSVEVVLAHSITNRLLFRSESHDGTVYESQVATALWRGTGSGIGIYDPPTRNWNFDNNFLDPNKLPPCTPAVRTLIRGQWTLLPPNTTTIEL